MSARAFFLINKKLNRFLLLFNLSFLPFSVIAANDTVDFDLSTLQARGLPTTLNDYFRTGSKFSPGMSKITPFINGVEKKTMSVNFDDQGELCLHREDLTTLGLKSIKSEDDRCIDLKSQYPQAEIKLEPGQNKVDFVLPSDAIEDTNNLDINQYAVGGIGGMLNYDVLMMKNHSKTSNIDTDNENDKSASNSNNINTFQSNTEEGFNFNDWIIRSRQSYSSSGDSRSLDQIYTYAQRTLPNYKTVMQTGKISVANSLFAIPQILGIQFSPESALMNNKESGATVTGIAQTQARVEVRQSGILIYSTQVPAGAFTLNRLPTINNTADLNVNVVEQDGATRSFLVPASSFTNSFSQQETSYSGAIGKIDQSDNDDIGSNELLTFNMSTPWGTRAMLNSGALLAQRYQSIAAQMSAGLANGLSLSGRSILSSDARSQTKGMQNYLSLSMPLVDRLSINSSVTRQDSGYRDLTDGMPHVDEDNDSINNRYKSQYSLGMGYSFEDLGSFNLSWSRVSMFSSDEPTSRMTAG
nr:fimbria/pilus outer membrane usher protein [Hafnia alvei]